jgi:hypothetical protein
MPNGTAMKKLIDKYLTEAKIIKFPIQSSKNSKLMELIKAYGNAMYELGENTDPNDNYYARQVGITLKKLKKYIEN